MIGIVYIIWVLGDFYVGSTWDMDERKRIHNSDMKTSNVKLYVAIRENNNNFVMTIHHEFICETDEELRQEEQRTMDSLKPNLNERRAYNSEEDDKEYHKKYDELHKEEKKEYYEENKVEILEKTKEYRELNKEKINEKAKQDRIDNPEKYQEKLEKMKEKMTCICGVEYNRNNKCRHERSNFHIDFCKENNIV